MRKRDVVGRRIIDVVQERVWNEHLNRHDWVLHAIVLDNGVRIRPQAIETEDIPDVVAVVVRPQPDA